MIHHSHRSSLLACVVTTVLLSLCPARAAVDARFSPSILLTPNGFTIREIPAAQGGTQAIEFTKTGEERRLLAFCGRIEGNTEGTRSVEMNYELKLTSGSSPRPALVLHGSDGGAWFRVYGPITPTGAAVGTRLSMSAWERAAFSATPDAAPAWANVSTAWVGFVFDGPATGLFRLVDLRFTDQPYAPTGPVCLTRDGASGWTCGSDKDAKTTLATPNEAADGKPCMRCDFEVPGGRHMYVTPSMSLTGVDADTEGMNALRFKGSFSIPAGMRLLICLSEPGGATYFCEPPPPWPGEEWGEVSLPLSQFKPASWGRKDDNETLDIWRVQGLTIGTHGTPAAAGKGLIKVADVELVP